MYSLSAGWGAQIVFGSFNQLRHNLRRSVPIAQFLYTILITVRTYTNLYLQKFRDVIISIIMDTALHLAGTVIVFTYIGHLHYSQGRPLPEIIPSENMPFIILAEAIGTSTGAAFFTLLFYSTVVFFGMDSQVSQFMGRSI